jgi:hypothetical protein
MIQGYLYETRDVDGRHSYFISSKLPLDRPGLHLCTVKHMVDQHRKESVVQF